MTVRRAAASAHEIPVVEGASVIAMWLTAMALVTTEASAPIAVAVVAPRDVTDSLVNRICIEAEAIWAAPGIALECTRDAPNHEGRVTLEVTIDDRRTPAGGDGALGWLTFKNDDPDRFIHLSRA